MPRRIATPQQAQHQMEIFQLKLKDNHLIKVQLRNRSILQQIMIISVIALLNRSLWYGSYSKVTRICDNRRMNRNSEWQISKLR